ncbi:hypothetical protein [Mesorhizobium sp. ISC11]
MDGTLPDYEESDYFYRLCDTIHDMHTPLVGLSRDMAAFDKPTLATP